jgi:ABC-type sugar transport system ATPase subunit
MRAGLLGSGADRVLRRLFGLETAGSDVRTKAGVVRLARPTDAIRAGIGMVPGERRLGLVMNLSVRDNILLPNLTPWREAATSTRRGQPAMAGWCSF